MDGEPCSFVFKNMIADWNCNGSYSLIELSRKVCNAVESANPAALNALKDSIEHLINDYKQFASLEVVSDSDVNYIVVGSLMGPFSFSVSLYRNAVSAIDEKTVREFAGYLLEKSMHPFHYHITVTDDSDWFKVSGSGTFIDISNLERANYGLSADMAEIYKTAVLKQYPFPVWPGETFTPEAVIWNRIALDGYLIRWHKDIIYLCEYLEDGLTRGGYPLYLKNLMGCAMANDLRSLTSKTVWEKASAIVETDVACCLKGELGFLRKTNYPLLSYFLLPFSWLLSIYRRIKLFRSLT